MMSSSPSIGMGCTAVTMIKPKELAIAAHLYATATAKANATPTRPAFLNGRRLKAGVN